MTIRRVLISLLLISPGASHADAIVENFSTRAALSSATAIWNQALGKVHPGLHVVNYKSGWTALPVDVGDGRHGAFELGTYAQFSVGGNISGNKVRIDTDAYPLLQVTSFKLEQGWTIEPVGSKPLIIYSLTDVIIEGTIACQGGDGGNGSTTTPGAGGLARCGGGGGGAGGAPGNPGTAGVSPHASLQGGAGAAFNPTAATPGASGGGGGSWNLTSAPSGGGLSTAAGVSVSDPEFTVIAGGAGGGGGAATTTGGNAGAGGGAGGGAVVIHAVGNFNLGSSTNATIGTINVGGGYGGGTGNQAGAGGGGGGGSVQVFAGGTINIYNTNGMGASRAFGGLGGTNIPGNNGGNGGIGRSWFAGNVSNLVGYYAPAEEAPVNDASYLGIVEFDPSAQYVETKTVDLANNFAQVLSMDVTPASSTFKIETAGSSDNFVADDTGFTQNINLISGKRYLKFRVTLAGGNVNTPDMVDTATINYVLGERKEFKLEAAGCGRVQGPRPPAPGHGVFFVLIFAFLGILKFKAQRQKSVRGEGLVSAAEQKIPFGTDP